MNFIIKISRLILLIVTVSMMTGCAVFAGGHIPQVTLVDNIVTSDKPSVSYQFDALRGLGKPKDLSDEAESKIKRELLEELTVSGYFGVISENSEDSDISIKVVLTNTNNPAALIPAFITGFSFYTIPSWATDKFEVKAKALSKNGLNKDYIIEDTSTLVQWLPMIFVFPFKNMSVISETRANMFRTILFNMSEDGFFDSPAINTTP